MRSIALKSAGRTNPEERIFSTPSQMDPKLSLKGTSRLKNVDIKCSLCIHITHFNYCKLFITIQDLLKKNQLLKIMLEKIREIK